LELSGVVERVLVLLGYMGDVLEEHLAGGDWALEVEPVKLEALDTADAIRRARDRIDDDFLVVMGDVITNCDVATLWRAHRERGGLATLALRDAGSPGHYGLALVGRDGRVLRFMESPASYELYLAAAMIGLGAEASTSLASMGIYAFSYEILDVLDENPHLVDFSRHVLPHLVEEGHPVYGWYSGSCYWIDIGLPHTYLQANIDMVSGLATPLRPRGMNSSGIWLSSPRSMEGVVNPPAAIGAHASVADGAVVGPGAVLGEEVEVGSKAVVVGSVLLAGAKVGEGAVVVGSVVGEGASVGKGARVLRSLVEDGARVPEGANIIGAVYVKKRACGMVVELERGARAAGRQAPRDR
ncbi:MAG: hypothetical protein DRJ67_11600, partial [Thermoprotei archaeon]